MSEETMTIILPEAPKERMLFFLRAAYARIYDADNVSYDLISVDILSNINAAKLALQHAIDAVKGGGVE